MLRRSPLKRKTRLRPKRKTQRRSGRKRDTEYMLQVKQLPCLFEGGDCYGYVEAHHAGDRPLGRKADDVTCVPLCHQHHRDHDHLTGPFRGWTRDEKRSWSEWAIEMTQVRLGLVTV